MRRYNGSAWESEITVEPTGFFARQSIAANQSGQVMYTWDKDSALYSKLYTPGSGWGSTHLVQSPAGFSLVVGLPGTNNFYCVYVKGDPPSRVCGRKWAGGGWLAEEIVSVGLPDAFTVDAQVACGPDGTLYACWEYWGGSNAPNAYYSVRPAPPPPSQWGTLAGVVRDQYGVGVAGVTVTVSGFDATVTGPGGAYSLAVPVGTYTVTASKPFFTSDTRNGVVVSLNQTTTLNMTTAGIPPAPVNSFSITAASSRANSLQWRNPNSANFSGSMLRYKTTGYPSGPTDGTLLVNRAGTPNAWEFYTHAELTVGATYYYSVYAHFDDASVYYSSGVNTSGACSGPADFDRDFDVDLGDFAAFQICFNGPNRSGALPGQCSAPDVDGDGDVDLSDFGLFQACFNGPNRLPVLDCYP